MSRSFFSLRTASVLLPMVITRGKLAYLGVDIGDFYTRDTHFVPVSGVMRDRMKEGIRAIGEYDSTLHHSTMRDEMVNMMKKEEKRKREKQEQRERKAAKGVERKGERNSKRPQQVEQKEEPRQDKKEQSNEAKNRE